MASGAIPWTNVPNSTMMAVWNKATVFKTPSFYNTDTRTRRAIISSNDVWKEFSKDGYLPWYYPRGEWSDPANKNWGIAAQAAQSPLELTQTSDLLLLSAYHTKLGKRVVIDGCHRAVAVETLVHGGKAIPPVEVIEIYGSQIHAIVFADFCNLVAAAL